MNFTDLIDLAAERVGGAVLLANDDFFAPKENLLKPTPAEWREHEYTDRGKWMDGWESRRRREPGYDWCVIRLGLPGIVRGVVVDTAFFRGNYPEQCSIEVCRLGRSADPAALAGAAWTEILPRSPLQGDSKNLFPIEGAPPATHLRLNIFPDGGVARLRVHGEVTPDWERLARAGGDLDLAAVEHGGFVVSCSDMFFGSRHNLIMPGRAANMSDGWENRRRRGPGNDWAIVRLGSPGTIHRVEVDTNHFKGNAPGACSLEGASGEGPLESAAWRELLPSTPLQPHTRHFFEEELVALGPVSHVRLNVFPDGGVSRLRLHGSASQIAALQQGLRRLNTLPREEALAALLSCCSSARWAERMEAARPFDHRLALLQEADRVARDLGEADWLEAFAHHPQIGEKKAESAQSAEARSWSAQEQAGTRSAAEETMAALAEGNVAYRDKFGFIFIVFASGRSAEEILALLRERLGRSREDELRAAAEEQRKITRLRLEKWLDR